MQTRVRYVKHKTLAAKHLSKFFLLYSVKLGQRQLSVRAPETILKTQA